ncbi:MAG: hypothetical protein ACLPZ0_20255 [Steroidobacteraceae bacterium]|jgi:hypothetical protein
MSRLTIVLIWQVMGGDTQRLSVKRFSIREKYHAPTIVDVD